MKIVHVRLVDRTSFIAYLVRENKNEYTFSEPMLLEEKLDQNGNAITVMTKYVYFETNKTIKIRKEHVILCCPMNDVFENYYEISKLYYTLFVEQKIMDNVNRVSSTLKESLSSSFIQNINKEIIH